MQRDGPLFDDPLRNGTLLCFVVSRIKKVHLGNIYKKPKSIGECRFNVEKALNYLRENNDSEFPLILLWKTNEILEGNNNIIFGIYYYLKKEYELQRLCEKNGNQDKSYRQTNYNFFQTGSKILPYSQQDMINLEISILNWLTRLNIFSSYSHPVLCFEELSPLMSKGILLCDLVHHVFNKKINSV